MRRFCKLHYIRRQTIPREPTEIYLTTDWTIKLSDIAIIFATLVGPILAVWASEWRQQQKAQQDRKEWVFRTLMSTRGAKLRVDHVAAINHIEFAFPRKTCPQIDDSRSLYRKHLRNQDSLSADVGVRQAWNNKANDLFSAMLFLMAQNLRIPFTQTDITEESYHPDAHYFSELEWQEIRNLTLQVLKNGRPIYIKSVSETTAA